MNGFDHLIDYLRTSLSEFSEGPLRPSLMVMLGLTFFWSGYAKVRSPWGAAFAVADFGLVRRPSLALAWLVAGGEVALAVTLAIAPAISPGLAVEASTVAACVLLLFCILIARSLHMGRSFDCACFGAAEGGLTPATLARAVALAVVASGCALAGPFVRLGAEELLLAWCAAAGLLAVPVLVVRAQLLRRLWRTSLEAGI
jgi:multisubunit Na+/H+ antiporter MnhB subunit